MNKSRIAQEIAHLSGDPARKKQSGMVHWQDDVICGINDTRFGDRHDAIIWLRDSAEEPPEPDVQTSGDDADGNAIRGRIH